MKGLLIKDIKMILHSKRLMVIWLAFIIFILRKYMNYYFIIGYTTMIGILLVYNTIAFDEQNKSITFLMTLPIKRETYVLEKYVLMAVAGFAGVVISSFFCILFSNEILEILFGATGILAVLIFMQFIMIPMQLKFGNERGRIVMVAAFAVVAVIATSFGNIADLLFVEGEALNPILYFIRKAVNGFLALDLWVKAAVLVSFYIICALLSYFVSRNIMRKREF